MIPARCHRLSRFPGRFRVVTVVLSQRRRVADEHCFERPLLLIESPLDGLLAGTVVGQALGVTAGVVAGIVAGSVAWSYAADALAKGRYWRS